MSLMHFKHTNLVDAGTVYRYSSQLDGLPATNIQNGLKLRLWRTESGFVVTGENCNFPFQDTASLLKNYSLPSGTYTGSALASVIESAMDSAGTYTGHVVLYTDSDDKFRFTKAASASILELLFNASAYSANNAAILLGFEQRDVHSGSTGYTSTTATQGNEHELVVEFSATSAVDSLIIDNHNLSTGTVMRYRLANSAAAFTNRWNETADILRSATITVTEDIISIEHTSTNALAMQLHWYDRSQAYSEIGRLWAGVYFEPSYHTSGEDKTWMRKRLRQRSKQVVSEGGATLVDKRDALDEYALKVDDLDPNFNNATKTGFEGMFDTVGNHQAFYISFSDDLENDTVYGIITRDIEYRRNRNTAVLQVMQFTFREQK